MPDKAPESNSTATDAAELVSVGAAARALGLDRRTLRALLDRDGVPLTLSRKTWRVSWITFSEWLVSHGADVERVRKHGEARHATRREKIAKLQAATGEALNA